MKRKMIGSSYFSMIHREFKGYNKGKFINDLMAGVTVAAVALPLALAFGAGSVGSAASGLITTIIAGIFIGGLSGASYQISGATGTMAVILLTINYQYGFKGVFYTGLLSGVVLLVAALFKLGRLVSFIPSPVITGFTSGIAIIIAGGQIDNFFGTTSKGANLIEKISSYGELGFVQNFNYHAIMYSLIVVAIMIFLPKKINAKIPGSLLGLVAALIIQMIFKFNITTVGEIPKTILFESRLRFSDIPFDLTSVLLPSAISIAALSMIESLLCGASAGKIKNEKLNNDQELVALGIGNLVLPFFGGIPATSALARTSVAIKSGGKTRVASIIHSLVLLAAMFILGDVLKQIPLAALAGVLMVTSFRMNDWSFIKYIHKKKMGMAIVQYAVTMIVTVVSDLTVAILVGVGVSMLSFVVQSCKINVECREVDTDRINDDEITTDHSATRVVYLQGPLFFGTQEQLFSELDKIEGHPNSIVFSMRAVPSVDDSVLAEFMLYLQKVSDCNIRVVFCGVGENVKRKFVKAGIYEVLGENCFFWDCIASLKALESVDEKQPAAAV